MCLQPTENCCNEDEIVETRVSHRSRSEAEDVLTDQFYFCSAATHKFTFTVKIPAPEHLCSCSLTDIYILHFYLGGVDTE